MKNQFDSFLNTASKLRDGSLVTAAILYFLGYIVWAVNAYVNNLGLLPALDVQYFVAGLLPASTIIILYISFKASTFVNKKVQNWLGPIPSGGKLYLSWVMFFLATVAVCLILVQDKLIVIFPNLDIRFFSTTCVFLIIISYPFLKTLKNRNSMAFLFQIYAFIFAVIFFIALSIVLSIYSVTLYSKIPQEFGGILPYYVCLDVEKSQLSKQTLEGILSPDGIKSKDSVAQSLKVEVLFSGSDVMLIRSQQKIYRISQNIIQVVSTCP